MIEDLRSLIFVAALVLTHGARSLRNRSTRDDHLVLAERAGSDNLLAWLIRLLAQTIDLHER